MTKRKEYSYQDNQVFFCLRNDGYFIRFKPKNNPEKRSMYVTYPFVIQVGICCKDVVRVALADGSFRDINPNSVRVGVNPQFLTSKGIKTISLEPKGEKNGNKK